MKNIYSFLFTCTLATVTTAHLGAMDLVLEEPVEKPSVSSTIALLTQEEQQTYSADMGDVAKNMRSPSDLCRAIGRLHDKHNALLVSRIVKTVIKQEKYACSFHCLTNNNGWTPLHCAASSGAIDTLNVLLALEVKPEELLFAVDRSAGTAFHCAAYQGHTEAWLALLAFTIKQLGKNKARELLCARNKWGATALHNAVLQRHKKNN